LKPIAVKPQIHDFKLIYLQFDIDAALDIYLM